MRQTSERMELLKKRTAKIKEKRDAKKYKAKVALCGLLSFVLIAVISVLACRMEFAEFEKISAAGTASILANKYFFSYHYAVIKTIFVMSSLDAV